MPMTDDEKIRFQNDLESIKHDIIGKDVKDSIHDALKLVGKYSGEGGGVDSYNNYVLNAYTLVNSAGTAVVGNIQILEV